MRVGQLISTLHWTAAIRSQAGCLALYNLFRFLNLGRWENVCLQIRVSWYWNQDHCQGGEVSFCCKSLQNMFKNVFGLLAASSQVYTFRAMQYICMGQKWFFHNIGFMDIKRRRISHKFQKYKLVLVTAQEAPMCSKANIYPKFTRFRGILSLIQVYIFEIYVKFWVF
jgi:hypothetical protein